MTFRVTVPLETGRQPRPTSSDIITTNPKMEVHEASFPLPLQTQKHGGVTLGTDSGGGVFPENDRSLEKQYYYTNREEGDMRGTSLTPCGAGITV